VSVIVICVTQYCLSIIMDIVSHLSLTIMCVDFGEYYTSFQKVYVAIFTLAYIIQALDDAFVWR